MIEEDSEKRATKTIGAGAAGSDQGRYQHHQPGGRRCLR